MTTRLDFSIGPVQGFVSQSRRTRDLWGSSWLLAFLSAHAMRGAVTAGGRLVRPDVRVVERDRLYRWVSGHRDGEPPRIGSLPNHFVLEVGGTAPASAPEVARAATRSLHSAWERVCVVVWRTFVQPVCRDGEGTDSIWDRQVRRFWEDHVDRLPRPNSRSKPDRPADRSRAANTGGATIPPEEPGDKCTVMHDWQELSGFVRARDVVSQDRFWRRIREGCSGSGSGLRRRRAETCRRRRTAMCRRTRQAAVPLRRTGGGRLGDGRLTLAVHGVRGRRALDPPGRARRPRAGVGVRGSRRQEAPATESSRCRRRRFVR